MSDDVSPLPLSARFLAALHVAVDPYIAPTVATQPSRSLGGRPRDRVADNPVNIPPGTLAVHLTLPIELPSELWDRGPSVLETNWPESGGWGQFGIWFGALRNSSSSTSFSKNSISCQFPDLTQFDSQILPIMYYCAPSPNICFVLLS